MKNAPMTRALVTGLLTVCTLLTVSTKFLLKRLPLDTPFIFPPQKKKNTHGQKAFGLRLKIDINNTNNDEVLQLTLPLPSPPLSRLPTQRVSEERSY